MVCIGNYDMITNKYILKSIFEYKSIYFYYMRNVKK